MLVSIPSHPSYPGIMLLFGKPQSPIDHIVGAYLRFMLAVGFAPLGAIGTPRKPMERGADSGARADYFPFALDPRSIYYHHGSLI